MAKKNPKPETIKQKAENSFLCRNKIIDELSIKYPHIIIPKYSLTGIIQKEIGRDVKYKAIMALKYKGVWLIPEKLYLKAMQFAKDRNLEIKEISSLKEEPLVYNNLSYRGLSGYNPLLFKEILIICKKYLYLSNKVVYIF